MLHATVSECVWCVSLVFVNAGGTRTTGATWQQRPIKKAAVKECFLRRDVIPGVVGCVDSGVDVPKGYRKTSFMCGHPFYGLNAMSVSTLPCVFCLVRLH